MDEFEARNVQREFEKISDNIAISCKKVMEKFDLSEEQTEKIIENVITVYNNLNLNIEDFFNLRNDKGY